MVDGERWLCCEAVVETVHLVGGVTILGDVVTL